MTHDYISGGDAEFNEMQNDISTTVVSNGAGLGILIEAVTELRTKGARWNDAYAKANNMHNTHNRTDVDIVEKKEARADYEKEIRLFVKRYLVYNSAVSDADRERMDLTVHSGKHTLAPVPDTAPAVEVDFSTRLQHTLRFRDSRAEGRAKPDKVHGCEIWSKIGADPVNAEELTFVAVNTRSPRTIEYRGKQRGQTVWYWLRWENTRGEHGPWSAPVSAIIA